MELSPAARVPTSMWHEIASKLDGKQIARLSMACTRLRRDLGVDHDHVWRAACLRRLDMDLDLDLVDPPIIPQATWFEIYRRNFNGTHWFNHDLQEEHINWRNIGGFVLRDRAIIGADLLELVGASKEERVRDLLESVESDDDGGNGNVGNVRSGLWIADVHETNHSWGCLVVRHIECFVGAPVFEELTTRSFNRQVALGSETAIGIFEKNTMESGDNARAFGDDWEGEIVTQNGAAIKAIVAENILEDNNVEYIVHLYTVGGVVNAILASITINGGHY